MKEVRTRIAPSPTGIPHIGNTRTALYNFLFAKNQGGKFFVRIEDTDQDRLVPDSLPKIMEIFSWLGLKHDNEPIYVQSEHLEIYRKKAFELVGKKYAYYCFCEKSRLDALRADQTAKHSPPKYDRHCLNLSAEEVDKKLKNKESYVIRLKIPDDINLTWEDAIRGKITVNSKEIDDQVILKSDGFPTYHLAVVIDDEMMKITHVLRGSEWISSTPKHILLYEAFGFEKPIWGHLPLLLGSDRSKLSKRHGAKSALDYREEGYLPEAVLNTMLFWGWSPKDNKQFFSLQEMINVFDLKGINKNDPVVDLKKFEYFNGAYIRQKTNEELLVLLAPYIEAKEKEFGEEKLLAIIGLIKDRMKKLSEWMQLSRGFFVESDVKQTLTLLQALDAACSVSTKNVLEKIYEYLKNQSIWENNDIWQKGLRKIANEFKIKHGDLFMILRVAVWGEKTTPPIYEAMKVIGIDKSLARINQILNSS